MFALAIGACSQETQDFVILRDLTILRGAEVVDFNIDQVQLSNGQILLWSEIQQASVPGSRREEFDRYVREIGVPLMRIRHRMSTRDFANLQPWVEQLLATVGDRESESSYLVLAAAVHYYLSQDDMDAAFEALIALLQIRARHPGLAARCDSETHLSFDSSSGVCLELLPIWFDGSSPKALLDRLEARGLEAHRTEKVSLTTVIYLGMLAASSDRNDLLNRILSHPELQNVSWRFWLTLIEAQAHIAQQKYQQALEKLRPVTAQSPCLTQAIALYLVGLSHFHLEKQNHRRAALAFLQIPASYGREFPELSAAAIFYVVNHDLAGETKYLSLERELVEHYSNTFFGRRFINLAKGTAKAP